MQVYKNYLVVFGGSGQYIEKLKVHESYKDVRVYDILTQEWLPADPEPKYRQFIP